jgi:Uma2 family endonuclease
MSDPALRPMSVEEYLRTEEDSPYKREYVGGFVYPLHGATRAHAGTSRAHALIAGNIYATLHRAAAQHGCRLYQSDMKLQIAGRSSYYYPDVMLVCGEPGGDADLGSFFETAPCFVVEVLSKHTAQNDRKAKYMAYTSLPSVQTYLIVEQTERRVYVYERQGDAWTLQDLNEGALSVPCLNISLSLDDIYAGVLPAPGP